ncbi:MAG: serine/threonine-protein kinase, partial [Candidatus Xenobia bacterium]
MPDRERLGRYRILRELGRGGMGVVYQAEDEMLARTVALKTLQIADAEREGLRKRLQREAQLSARLNHQNVITLFDMGNEDGLDFLVLEYVEGRTLRDLLNSVGRMRLNEALAIFRDMAEGVAHAHEKGIVHRDLKPENVMVTADGRGKVMDFGLAWAAYQAKLTQTGAVMGTLAYFSPEQARGQTADERSDLYSLGAILFELLTGELLFNAKSPVEMIMHHLETPPRSIVQVVPSLTPELDAVVRRCLQKDPKNRYPSVRAMLAVLPTAAPRPMTPPPSLSMPPAMAFKSMTQVTQVPATPPAATGAWGPFQRAMARLGEVVADSGSIDTPTPKPLSPSPPTPPAAASPLAPGASFPAPHPAGPTPDARSALGASPRPAGPTPDARSAPGASPRPAGPTPDSWSAPGAPPRPAGPTPDSWSAPGAPPRPAGPTPDSWSAP